MMNKSNQNWNFDKLGKTKEEKYNKSFVPECPTFQFQIDNQNKKNR